MAGCDNKIPMEENLWPETVYLVGAKDKIINRDLNIGYEKIPYMHRLPSAVRCLPRKI